MLIGNTMATAVYGFFIGKLVLLWFGDLSFHFSNGFILLLQIVISTFVITAEFPKVFFKFMPIL
jgi:hypothetical protein